MNAYAWFNDAGLADRIMVSIIPKSISVWQLITRPKFRIEFAARRKQFISHISNLLLGFSPFLLGYCYV